MPYIPPPQRVDLNALPPSLLVFPRDDYTHGAYRTPCGPFVDPTHVVLAAAARRATRVWRTALSSGDWRRVDTRCFCLVVLDKVVQINVQRRFICGIPWPLIRYLDDWRVAVRDLAAGIYDIASTQAPWSPTRSVVVGRPHGLVLFLWRQHRLPLPLSQEDRPPRHRWTLQPRPRAQCVEVPL
ncbi:hypothetical protein CC85DRAFT_138894 [Cutaneotrichosporon oleaginosum]|uniref:Uncharacterized protein n=1 Tax=Cutaneotrichosporon oleaginosum TaxID=879819 RepID=A0A0J1AZS4_9TREE|nr:uncharacterized protein CC85DRAFT_138894 [Cutaneotrichosporon oleaginosum]KLT40844.1 hypothetical protein CC85DRAFT_138894 [Cutaneotrichosporon oleaginosum]TXT09296.1 hypothetical protein COLE_03230 [Cutaneotrichosporon oleaginosum]